MEKNRESVEITLKNTFSYYYGRRPEVRGYMGQKTPRYILIWKKKDDRRGKKRQNGKIT